MNHFGEGTWEFLRDDRFIQWVLYPDAANSAWWEQWQASHAEKVPVMEKARQMVLELHRAGHQEVDAALPEDVYTQLELTLAGNHRAISPLLLPLERRSRWGWWASAAAVLAGIVLTFIYLRRDNKPALASALSIRTENEQLTRTNTSDRNQVAYLADGSMVILEAGASIQHDAFLANPERKIVLKGDAFFEVASDAARPFVVYTPEVGIRVLGTSFSVSGKNGHLTVTVKTGKIAVFGLADKSRKNYIVTPNHKISFDTRTAAFLADSAAGADIAALQPDALLKPFAFDNVPVTEIFRAMEAAYSIKININETAFSKCLVTTTLTNESLENKLKIICSAINASYRISGGQVYITGKPCS
ncbi:FecR domain-containing protein [Chitinophaga sp. 212800010-3]|uniref:FecR family protein n=1 Tax=unclassified Chitinophaga TaxID=2619133 RepID=UPI002DF60393|nr:FecR domain-containing protein [Chitinophaga sp. 212800010-3]